jgi:hypothetical protein
MGHSLLWGPEAQGDFTRWCQLGGLWPFVALHGAFFWFHVTSIQAVLTKNAQRQSTTSCR